MAEPSGYNCFVLVSCTTVVVVLVYIYARSEVALHHVTECPFVYELYCKIHGALLFLLYSTRRSALCPGVASFGTMTAEIETTTTAPQTQQQRYGSKQNKKTRNMLNTPWLRTPKVERFSPCSIAFVCFLPIYYPRLPAPASIFVVNHQ